MEQASAKEYAQVMAEAQKKGLLNRNPQQVQRVRTIAQRLIPQTRVFRQDALQMGMGEQRTDVEGHQRLGDAGRQDGCVHGPDRAT